MNMGLISVIDARGLIGSFVTVLEAYAAVYNSLKI
jgi:hypothetical protein